jgi:UDP-N-acetylmuramoylalanine--D-glutamate ligase
VLGTTEKIASGNSSGKNRKTVDLLSERTGTDFSVVPHWGGILLFDNLDQFKREIIRQNIAVLGLGISNTPLVKYLCGLGAKVTAFDRSDEAALEWAKQQLQGLDVQYRLGENYLDALHGFDLIFKTPQIRYDLPELLREKAAGAVVTSEMEVFCSLCPARLFGVTGSDGKTTTSTLIYHILSRSGYRCWLGGNIGTPLLDRIEEIDGDDMAILELSSFQLHTMHNRIHTAVLTNISPNHLDVHKSMEEYIQAKKNVFLHQLQTDTVILNFDNSTTRGFAEEAPDRTVFFSRKSELEEGVFLSGEWLVSRRDGKEDGIVRSEEILLPGVHNIENYLAAAAATRDFVNPDAVREVAASFRGVEHRIEHVRDLNGVHFYNDSIGSSPSRTIASVNSFREKVILIAGGYNKHIPYDGMGKTLADRVKCLVLIGQTAALIENALVEECRRRGVDLTIPVFHCASLEEAVKTALDSAAENDIIILSPASASFDLFKNFEERGLAFKQIVNNL